MAECSTNVEEWKVWKESLFLCMVVEMKEFVICEIVPNFSKEWKMDVGSIKFWNFRFVNISMHLPKSFVDLRVN